jgi:hypothetical protein
MNCFLQNKHICENCQLIVNSLDSIFLGRLKLNLLFLIHFGCFPTNLLGFYEPFVQIYVYDAVFYIHVELLFLRPFPCLVLTEVYQFIVYFNVNTNVSHTVMIVTVPTDYIAFYINNDRHLGVA